MASMELCQLQYYDKYVSRTMRCLPDKFTELCHMHLAFLLDLSVDKLELLLSGNEHKKRKSGLPSVGMFKKKDKTQGLFGLPLTDEGVCLMMPLIQFLKMEDNVTNEGLFRIPGNKSKMTTLRELLISHGPAVDIDQELFSVHDVASVLKEFIRELPEPLLTERHLEAHMHILALGQQAKTPEEAADYSSRKLSAVQLLMLLLPTPAQILTMHLVKLLKKIADSPESRMTPATLGTIFAPAFMIDRKGQPFDLLSQIAKSAPAISFIIDKADELFQAPKELVMDLTKFWKSMKRALLHTENRESSHMQKSLSGQTLYPDLCVADSNLSTCDDGTSNITAELANLLQQMQKHKDKAKKSFDAPEFCASLRRRSRSIGSSIRKRLPSLKNTRNRQEDTQRSRASSLSAPRSDSKTVTSTESCQIECSTETSEARCSSQLPKPKPGQKRRHNSENCPTAMSSSSSNSPVKQKCQETATCKISLAGKQKHVKNAGGEARLPPNGRSSNAVSGFVEKRNTRGLISNLEYPAPYDTENKKHIKGPAACDIKNKLSTHHMAHSFGELDLASSHVVKPKLNLTHAVSADSPTTRKIAKSATDRKSRPVTNTRQQQPRKPLTVTSAESCQIECSTETSEASCFLQLPKPGQRHHLGSKNCPTTVSSSNGNPPVKQKCHKTATCASTLKDNQKHGSKADCGAQLPLKHASKADCGAQLPTINASKADCGTQLPPKHASKVDCGAQLPPKHASKADCGAQLPPKHASKADCGAQLPPKHASKADCGAQLPPKHASKADCGAQLPPKHASKADCGAQLPPNRRSTNVGSEFVEKRSSRGLASDLEGPALCDIENKENNELSTTFVIGNKRSTHHISHFNGISDSNILKKKLGPAQTDSTVSMVKHKASSVHFEDKENVKDPVACDIKNKLSTHHMSLFFGEMDPVSSYVLQHMLRPAHGVSADLLVTKKSAAERKSRPVTNTRQQQSRKPLTTVKSNGTIRLGKETSV